MNRPRWTLWLHATFAVVIVSFVGATAIGQSGKEGSLLRQTFLWSLLLTAVVGVISLLQATILTAMIPSP